MGNTTDGLNLPTKDKAITLKLTFLEFGIIDNCLRAVKETIVRKTQLGGELEENQESVLNMVEGVIGFLQEQAKTSSGNLDVGRVMKELEFLSSVSGFFAETYTKVESDNFRLSLEYYANQSKSK